MRVFAISDIHVDHDANAKWIRDISRFDYQDDILMLAGDVTRFWARHCWRGSYASSILPSMYTDSHINRSTRIDGITYVNSAFGYPSEAYMAARRLLCIDDT